MKRKDLKAGMVVAFRRHADSPSFEKVGVLDTEPWVEGKSHYGRFGSVGNGRYRAAGYGDSRNGVAVLRKSTYYRSNGTSEELAPAVVQLSKLEPLAEAEARVERAKVRAAERQTAAEALTAELNALNAAIEVLTGENPRLYSATGYSTNVSVSLLEKLVGMAQNSPRPGSY